MLSLLLKAEQHSRQLLRAATLKLSNDCLPQEQTYMLSLPLSKAEQHSRQLLRAAILWLSNDCSPQELT
jgi:hypothetical protein